MDSNPNIKSYPDIVFWVGAFDGFGFDEKEPLSKKDIMSMEDKEIIQILKEFIAKEMAGFVSSELQAKRKKDDEKKRKRKEQEKSTSKRNKEYEKEEERRKKGG
ncbi:hypothetical protein AgCh_017353 [Apium graveolens]